MELADSNEWNLATSSALEDTVSFPTSLTSMTMKLPSFLRPCSTERATC